MDVVCSVFVCAEVSMNAQNHPRLRRVECDRDVNVLEKWIEKIHSMVRVYVVVEGYGTVPLLGVLFDHEVGTMHVSWCSVAW